MPSVVVAEVLRGRCEFSLKATPDQVPHAYRLLFDTMAMLQTFDIALFDEECARIVADIRTQVSVRKRYVDVMIAAIAISTHKTLVTRNKRHFTDLLPPNQIVNWIDDRPH